MGVYVFNTVLRRLIDDERYDTEHDFGKISFPMIKKGLVFAFLFWKRRKRPGYWRDVGHQSLGKHGLISTIVLIFMIRMADLNL
jgi:ADP-glucose pyrophosphorylase